MPRFFGSGRRDRRAGPDNPINSGAYTDFALVATGGSSNVYRARQPAFDRTVAVKVLTEPLADERTRRRFSRELAVTGRLGEHPHIVTVHEYGLTSADQPFVVMAWYDGGSTADLIRARNGLDPATVTRIGVRIAGALAYAHAAGVVHRDVKPQNILLSSFGEPALTDFGVATRATDQTAVTSAFTPVHAAPEVLQGRDATPASDIWSLGSALWTLLAGRPPFAAAAGEGLLDALLRVVQQPLPSLARTDVPSGLREALERAMAKEPERRWPSVTAFAEALQQVQRDVGGPVTDLVAAPEPSSAHTIEPGSAPSGSRGHAAAAALPATPTGGEPPPASSPAVPAEPGEPARQRAAGGDDERTRLGRRGDVAVGPEEPAKRRWWRRPAIVIPIVAAVLAFAGGASYGVIRALHHAPAPPKHPKATASSSPSTRTRAGGAAKAPRKVHVTRDAGSKVSLAWTDPNDGRYPYVVFAGSKTQKADATSHTTVTGLDPSRGYCFRVAAVLTVTGKLAKSEPVCIRGATPPSATAPAPPTGR